MNTTSRSTLFSLICCGGFGMSALCAFSASAQAVDPEPLTRTVKFSDLDISKPAGAKTLYGRIRAAAKNVCPDPGHSDRHRTGEHDSCIKNAIDDAVRYVNAPQLTALRFGSEIRLASK